MQKNTQLCKVNRENLRFLVRERQLKFWWVAEQAGIHKTTLRRWLSGKIERAHEVKVAEVAQILNIEPATITLSE